MEGRKIETTYKLGELNILLPANAKDIEIKVFEELRERQLKGAYKLPEEEIQLAIKTSYEDIDFYLSGGESVRDVHNRAIPVIKDLLNNYQTKTIIIGTHGNVITMIMNYFNKKNAPSERFSLHQLNSLKRHYILLRSCSSSL